MIKKSGLVLALSTTLIFVSTEAYIAVGAEPLTIYKTKQQRSGYGLGLPKTAGTGGSARVIDSAVPGLESSSQSGTVPQLALIVPEDGASTINARPTFYWYVFGKELNYKATFYLYESESVQPLFQAESTITTGGMYKLTLPESAPPLEPGKARRWTVKLQNPDQKQSDQVLEASGMIVLTNPAADLVKSNAPELDKARIYASKGYWYDALNAYSNWITTNPKDQVAIAERTQMLKEVLKNRPEFTFASFAKRINAAAAKEVR
jgi:Domain of Unknown Function (DUF928)